MNKRVRIAILIALIGIIAILALQVLWVSTSYKQEQKKLVQRTMPLTKDVRDEVVLRNSTLWYKFIQDKFGNDIIPYIGGAG